MFWPQCNSVVSIHFQNILETMLAIFCNCSIVCSGKGPVFWPSGRQLTLYQALKIQHEPYPSVSALLELTVMTTRARRGHADEWHCSSCSAGNSQVLWEHQAGAVSSSRRCCAPKPPWETERRACRGQILSLKSPVYVELHDMTLFGNGFYRCK